MDGIRVNGLRPINHMANTRQVQPTTTTTTSRQEFPGDQAISEVRSLHVSPPVSRDGMDPQDRILDEGEGGHVVACHGKQKEGKGGRVRESS